MTYNLHAMIRFDLELDLLEGNLPVRELPEAWDARYESDLARRPPRNDGGVTIILSSRLDICDRNQAALKKIELALI